MEAKAIFLIKDSFPIINIDSDEDVICAVESTTNDDFGDYIPPSQATNEMCYANNDETNPTHHELSSNIVAN